MQYDISPSELEIMRLLWAESPLTSRQIIDRMSQISSWKEGTIKSLIHRLITKHMIHQDDNCSPYLLIPTVTYKEVTYQQIENDLKPICSKHRGELIKLLIANNELSQENCDELIELLQNKKLAAPIEVSCNCPAGQCQCHHLYQ